MARFLGVFIVLCICFVFSGFCCTTFLVTKKATTDGSAIVGHTDDDEFAGDQRIIYVAPKDFKEGSKRAVYPETSNYPRYVGKERSSAYDLPNISPTEPLGYIDQVKHTYGYIEGNYPIINEHQLAMGECTDSTYFYFDFDKKDRIFGISELARIAMERCIKAKEAIKLMGELAEKYGYYGFGETLLLADKEDGWIFEISCSPTGKSAIWVAKKVPDGEVFVAANQFRIQEINSEDPDVLYSSNLWQVAKEQGWIDDSKEQEAGALTAKSRTAKSRTVKSLDWQKALCPGEFDHPYYSLRRVWRFFSLLNPSFNLSPYVKDAYTKYYPFSIKPDKKISMKRALSFFRDHYEGTEFDMTKGVGAGPFGCPNRYLGDYDRTDFPNKQKEPLKGAWERSISIFYTGYSYITQVREWLPDAIGGISWVAFDEPYNSCYMPIYCGVTSLSDILEECNPNVFNEKHIWWNFNFLSNWIDKFYKIGIQDIQKKQSELETFEMANQQEIEKKALEIYHKNSNEAKIFITDFCAKNIKKINDEWLALTKILIVKYNDGFINIPKIGQSDGYSAEWLEKTEYSKGPTEYEKNK